jgi:hypothetical protein
MTTTNAQHTPGDMIRVHGKSIRLADYVKSHDALLAALEECLPDIEVTEYASEMVKERYARVIAAIRAARGK